MRIQAKKKLNIQMNPAAKEGLVKKIVRMCTCSFACPSIKDRDFEVLAERTRLELLHEYMLLRPRQRETNGETLMEDLLQNDSRQRRMEKEAKIIHAEISYGSAHHATLPVLPAPARRNRRVHLPVKPRTLWISCE